MNEGSDHTQVFDLLSVRDGLLVDPPPAEAMAAVTRLGYDDFTCGIASSTFDEETGVTTWEATLATETAVVELHAKAVRMVDPLSTGSPYAKPWSIMLAGERGPKTYDVAPLVTVQVRRLADLRDLTVVAERADDTFEAAQQVREVWTFRFTDGSESIVLRQTAVERDRVPGVSKLCRHLASCM